MLRVVLFLPSTVSTCSSLSLSPFVSPSTTHLPLYFRYVKHNQKNFRESSQYALMWPDATMSNAQVFASVMEKVCVIVLLCCSVCNILCRVKCAVCVCSTVVQVEPVVVCQYSSCTAVYIRY